MFQPRCSRLLAPLMRDYFTYLILLALRAEGYRRMAVLPPSQDHMAQPTL